MARSIRIQFCGAYYHVMARGNRRESIFVTDADRRLFLPTLSEAVGRTGWRFHAWVLMETSIARLVDQALEHDQCRERGNGGAAGNSEIEIVDLAKSIARSGEKGAQGRLIEYHLAASAFPVTPDRNRMKRSRPFAHWFEFAP